jgi:hypothetical protein
MALVYKRPSRSKHFIRYELDDTRAGGWGVISLKVEMVAFRFSKTFSKFRRSMTNNPLNIEANYYSEILMPDFKSE